MDVQEFLTLYPWQPEHLAAGEPLHWLWTIDMDSTPEEMWPFVIETSKINREVGYDEAYFEERQGVLHGWMTAGKRPVEWIEIPWNWNYARSLGNIRLYSSGMMRAHRSHLHVGEKLPDGRQRVHVYVGVVPTKPEFVRWLQPYFDSKEEGYRRAFAGIDGSVRARRHRDKIFSVRPITLADEGRLRIERIRRDLIDMAQPADLVDRLLDYLFTADEMDLYRIRVVELARRWETPVEDVLSVALYAVRAGLLTLTWDVVCPHCRNVRHEMSSLARVTPRGRCEVCGIDFNTADENALEVTFHIHASIADVPRRFYCLGEASSKPHIKLQYHLPPGQSVELQTSLREGHYRLRNPGDPAITTLELDPSAAASSLSWDAGCPPDGAHVMPNPTICLANPTSQPKVFVVEETHWAQDILRPSVLFNQQDFRDLFSQEALATDLYLDIGMQTIMFSDAVGSTRLYATRGDAAAFAVMKRYFETVFEVAKKYRGVVVKTIGDGAMLAFPAPEQGFAAALEIQKKISSQDSDGLQVRASLHSGRCLAVNLNTGIDYFGQTVNIAAKLQMMAPGGGLVISYQLLESPEVRAIMQREGLRTQPGKLDHPSLPQPITAFTVTPAA